MNITTINQVRVPTDPIHKDAFEKKYNKAKIVILDAIKDHVMPHVSRKDHPHHMWTTLTNLYQSSNENQKMVLRENLKGIWMNKGENMAIYPTRITQVRDELGAIGEVV